MELSNNLSPTLPGSLNDHNKTGAFRELIKATAEEASQKEDCIKM
jgi:hypothetical protein